jgi:hypothetical protein
MNYQRGSAAAPPVILGQGLRTVSQSLAGWLAGWLASQLSICEGSGQLNAVVTRSCEHVVCAFDNGFSTDSGVGVFNTLGFLEQASPGMNH